MKKVSIFVFPFLVLGMVSCGNLSSAAVSSPFVSSGGSAQEATGLASIVAKRAFPYDGGKSENALLSASGLSPDCAFTEGNLVRLLKAAFSSFMPPKTGQRNYIGHPGYAVSPKATTKEVESALEWLSPYGLYHEFSDEAAEVSVDDVERILSRFYQYFGTNAKDDFATASQYGFYFGDPDDDGHTCEDIYGKANIVNERLMHKTIEDTARAYAVDSSNPHADSYKQALDFLEGEVDYSFLAEPGVAEEITGLSSPSSLTDWVAATGKMFADYGVSPFFSSPTFVIRGSYEEAVSCEPGVFDVSESDLNDGTVVSSLRGTYETAFGSLGFSSAKSTLLADSLLSFARRQKSYYVGEYAQFAKRYCDLYDASTSQDLYEGFGLALSLSDVAGASGLSNADLGHLICTNEGLCLSSGKAIAEAGMDELGALGLYTFYRANRTTLSYKKGQRWLDGAFEYLVKWPLATDFLASEACASNVALAKRVLSALESSFVSRSENSPWLSEGGAEAIADKLSGLTFYLYSAYPDGAPFDYSSVVSPISQRLSKDLGTVRNATWRLSLNDIESEMSPARAYMRSIDPFLANAFYMPVFNSVTITLGFLFAYGGDFASFSDEALFASLGIVTGHEMTHGYDKNGSHYDKDGRYLGAETTIFGEADQKTFAMKQNEISALYEGYECLPDTRAATKGSLTITEDMADIGGLGLVEGIVATIDGFDYKEFYRDFSYNFADKETLASYLTYNIDDVHPYGRARVNRLLSNSGKFAETFALEASDAMYVAPEDRVALW
ncbi:MAG: hypothetical protein LKK13_00400 [Bacilli bacterium]|jgi:hypothetical protein|nr:hypothetical protein [Bacilli bacterium]